ncbi:peptidase domain-containing ABC transporter [Sphingomonas sp.]|uniref:peptidase domain-containing ABC transporter n=1 Tax=Sphingomonas sp. TaxID=28214 RepID=UPI0025F77659|nr:peptidase domain-containing ABC transporter [Sphingomonas sp.]
MNAVLDLGMWRQSRVRLIRQSEVAECGLASLAMVANFYGLDVDLVTLRRRFQPSLRGAALKSLIAMADQLGLSPRAVKLPLEKLPDLHAPAILHWNMSHYVVLERMAGGKALIHDPEGTSRWISLADVSPHFTGVALELRPTNDFEPSHERNRLKLSQLWKRVTGLKRAVLQTIVLSIVMEAFVLTSPYYMQVAIDDALPALDHDLLTVLALGFGLFTIINAGASLLRSFVLLSAGTALGFGVASNVARRLFRLPVSWFEKRHVGDVLSRFQSVTPIQQFMTQGAASALIDGCLAVFTLALMFFYSSTLTLIALTAFALYALVRAASFAAQRSAQEQTIVASGKEQSTMIESLRGIVTLRLFNRESARHAVWQTRLTDALNASVSLARVGVWQSTANTLIFGLETTVSVWIAVNQVIDGGFSVGMVFAYMAYKTQFLQRAASLIDQSIAFRMLGLHLERLSDIALADQDASITEQTHAQLQPLKGGLELRGVSYRYSPTDPIVLDNVNLTVEPGEYIAITGPSGGGKSTLAKLMLSLLEPDAGEVLVDGQPLSRFGYRNYRAQIAAVLQEDSLFAGSLADNIALFDDEPNMDRIVASAQLATIHDDVMSMPMGFETLVGDMGSSLSGGQKQRLLLARAIYRRPRMLVLDEGTSHLDAGREQRVNAAIAELGITRIVIAHRLETIVRASRILEVNQGRIEDVTERYEPMKMQLVD